MKKLISVLMSFVMMFTVVSTVSTAYAGSSYNSDYRRWSQGKSAYSDMRNYGCLVVAMAKMVRESGIKTSGFNPDTLYNWLVSNKYLVGMRMQSFDAPVAYAKSVNNYKLSYKGRAKSDILNKAKNNAKNGYYSIIEVTGHYFIVDNKTTNSKGSVYIYDSWNSKKDPGVPMSITTTSHGETVYTKRLVSIYTYAYSGSNSNSNSGSSSSIKNPSVSVKGASSITNSSARIDFTANNPSRVTIKTVGVQIRKKGDSSWKTKSEAMNSSYVNASSVPMWWTVGSGKEVNMALSSGTTYEYRAYVVYNGNNYYSSTASFTTSGSHTHSWGSGTVVQSPTCYAPGFRKYTCSGCGAIKTESINKTSHNFVLDSQGNSNCLNPGKKTYICTTCGYTKTEDIPAKEHKFSEWKTYKEATCEEDGEQKRMCTVCGFEEVKKIPAGHKFEDGYCTICGAEENEDFDDEYEDEYEESVPPARANIKKLQSKKKTVVVLWNTISDARGYQVQLSTDKKFKKNKKSYSIGNQKANKKTVKKLKAKKKYFVRVRAFKVVDGKKTYGKWSKVKSVKTK